MSNTKVTAEPWTQKRPLGRVEGTITINQKSNKFVSKYFDSSVTIAPRDRTKGKAAFCGHFGHFDHKTGKYTFCGRFALKSPEKGRKRANIDTSRETIATDGPHARGHYARARVQVQETTRRERVQDKARPRHENDPGRDVCNTTPEESIHTTRRAENAPKIG